MIGKIQTSIVVAAILAATTGSAIAEGGKTDPMQVARGAKAWSENCGRCHNLRDPKELSDKGWDVVVDHMRVVVPLPGQVARDIKEFLKASN